MDADARKTRGIHRYGTRANQPSVADVYEGTLYFVSDENQLERSDGTNWVAYSPLEFTEIESISSTGTQNDLTLTKTGPVILLQCTGASALTITGIANPKNGQAIYIQNLGTSTVKVTNQDTGSTAANRIITPAAQGQILGIGGLLLLIYDTVVDRWYEFILDPGQFITVAYNAGDFTASAGTWTVASGDVAVFTYSQKGKTVTVKLGLNTTSVSSTPSQLFVLIPGGFTALGAVLTVLRINDNGTERLGIIFVSSSTTIFIRIINMNTGALINYSASTDATTVQGEITFTVT